MYVHKCTLLSGESMTRWYKRSIQIWDRSPRTARFFRSAFEIERERRKHALTYPKIIHPCSQFRTFYEIWMIFVLIGTIIYLPIYTSFPTWRNEDTLHVDLFLLAMVSVINCIDMMVNLLTGYIGTKDEVVCDPKKIAKRFFYNKWIFCDVPLFIILPTIRIILRMFLTNIWFPGSELFLISVFKMARLLKYLRRLCKMSMGRISWHFEILLVVVLFLTYIFNFSKKQWISFFSAEKIYKQFAQCPELFARLCECLILVLVVFHWTACFFFLISTYRWWYFNPLYPQVPKTSWLTDYQITLETSLYDLYITSLYKSISCLLAIKRSGETEGHGTLEERTSESMVHLGGKIIIGWMTVTILDVFLNLGRKEREYQETINQITGYMRRKNLPEAMQQRMVRYYEYKYNRTVFRESEILDSLSSKLVNQIRTNEISTLIESGAFFDRLDRGTLDCISKYLTAEVYLENDVIVKAGQIGDCMYFIMHGTVAALTPRGEEICHLQDGAYFGEICMFIKDMVRPGTVVALERCTVYRLDKKALRMCIKDKRLIAELEQVAQARLTEMEALMLLEQEGKIRVKRSVY